MKLPEKRTLLLKDIVPYENNARRITDEAVAAVAESITRYGYQQPIIVDRNHVIVVGHTRYQALLSLNWTAVEVYVTDLPTDKANEYRLIDNRTGEMSEWNHEKLVLELREFESGLLSTYFPDIDLEIGLIDSVTTQDAMDHAQQKITKVAAADPTNTHTTEIVCPSCFHSFHVRTRTLPGITHQDLSELSAVE